MTISLMNNENKKIIKHVHLYSSHERNVMLFIMYTCIITSILKLDLKVFSQYISWLKVMYLSRNSKKKSSSVRFERLSNIESTVRSVDADPILHRVPAAVL